MRTSLVRTLFLLFIAGGFLVSGLLLLWFTTLQIPSVTSFHNRKVAESTKIYDRTGEVLLYDVHGTIRRTVVPFDKISRHIKNAAIAIEDTEFYEHHGVRPTAFIRAVFANIREGRFSQGGSTITQQVVKNTLLSSEKTITRKVKEWILAIKIERVLTKDQILAIYLNETPYGGTLYGVEEASQYFFNKPAFDVTLAEAAYLAALPQAPTYYSPFGNHRDALEARKNLVLLKMRENNFITEEEYREALTEQVVFVSSDETGIKAPHFVFYIREYLEETYGTDVVSEGGLSVITTLDYTLQKKAEEIVREYALKNAETFNAENASLVAIDPRNGQILSMVGSRGYFDDNIDGKFNIAVAKRQPGSAFKPFVYAAAFEKGYTPETVVFDLQTQFSTSCEANFFETNDVCYAPGNYDDVFRGPMSLRDALAQSVNIPAVKVLYLVGVKNALETASRLGITTLIRPLNEYGLPLVLGGGEVSLLEMVSAYGVFANNGVRHPITSVLSVKDAQGEELEKYTESLGIEVLAPQVAQTITNVLSDNNARTPAFGANSALHFAGRDVAVKTGTTNDYRDVWIIGYTPSIAVGAWAGNNDNTPMEKKVAGFIIAPLWNAFMQEVLASSTPETFPQPEEIATSELPPVLRGEWVSTEGVHSILYWVDKEKPYERPKDPSQDPQFNLWEYPVSLWAAQNGFATTTPVIQTQTSGSPQGMKLFFTVTYPQEGSVVPQNKLLTIATHGPEALSIQSVSYYINGNYMGASVKHPYSLSVFPSQKGPVLLTAIAETSQGVIQDSVRFVIE